MSNRVEKIRAALESALHPDSLAIIDNSHLHAGHAGARDGKGHFKVIIQAHDLQGKSLIKQHRLIYQALHELMQTDIHALEIETTDK